MKLTKEDIEKAVSGYPPILLSEQVASLLQTPLKTIHEWSSQGRFANCAVRRGRRLLFFRDKLIEVIFNGDWK